MDYTIENVRNLSITNLQEALEHSINKWDWLISLSENRLKYLLASAKITISSSDCPMCKFMNHNCEKCVLTKVCSNEFQNFSLIGRRETGAFSNFENKVDFDYYAEKVRDGIAEIYDMFFGACDD